MGDFFYKASNDQNKLVEGTISANSRDEAAHILRNQNLLPLVLKSALKKVTVRGTIPAIEIITFCRYLGATLNSGLSLSEAIEAMLSQTTNPMMKRILSDMNYSVQQGQQLSIFFAKYPDVFQDYFLALTRAGEVSGKMSEMFQYLESELRAEYNLQSKIKGALMYPAIIFVAMLGMGILMFFFILPQIGKVFLGLNFPLPAYTKVLFNLSISLSNQIIPIALGVVLFVVIGVISLRKKRARMILTRVIQQIPMVRNMIKKIDLARFNRIFSTLIKSAIPITEALEISLKSLSYSRYRRLASVLPEEIKKGRTLSVVMKEQNVFPSLMIQMIAAGEKSASIDKTMHDLAVFYEQEVEEQLKNLTQIIEPVLMLFVGAAVGGMILSIIAPIYSVVGSFQTAAGPG